jgi:hypothetical protein
MPDPVQDYVGENYAYTTEYYINFFEACDRLAKARGRIGMLVPRSFMFRESFEEFRKDFIGDRGAFDFLAEFGLGVLDNAVVRTVGTVVRSELKGEQNGTFFRLDDVETGRKEDSFLHSAFVNEVEQGVQRKYIRNISEFRDIPGETLSYWVPKELREHYTNETVLDAEKVDSKKGTVGSAKVGLQTGHNKRFVRNFWEHNDHEQWPPFAKGGADAWALPRIKLSVLWGKSGSEVKRYSKSYPRNVGSYFNEALTYTVMKTSGRRFGYLHDSSVFGTMGSVFIPERATWSVLSYTNSHFFTYLMIAQTVERDWKRRIIAKVPWKEELEQSEELESAAHDAVAKIIDKRRHDFVSPHYDGPLLLLILGIKNPLKIHETHPHRDLREKLDVVEPKATIDRSASLRDVGIAAAKRVERLESQLQSCVDVIDQSVFDCFNITENQQNTILQEIDLRTSENPYEHEEYNPNSITEPSEDFAEQVKDLLLHFVLQAVHESDDGIIPVSDIDGEDDLLTHIKAEFERVWGEYADDRLAEVDEVLGSQNAGKEAYPNLRTWVEEELFDYHVRKFDRTPILWRLTTERLVSDPEGEGFGCLIDYHQLNEGIFDRLQNRYLEPRKSLLRERRSAANRRRGNDSLSASEQAVAAEEHAQFESGLEQIAVFEDRLAELAQSQSRQWSTDEQQVADTAAERVCEFRHRTEERLEIVDELASMEDVDMSELFTGNFYEKVENQRGEWLDALEDLEAAFEAYAADSDQPVEAHLYDLFDYYTNDLLGSSHFASNGILYMTYYFDDFEQADQARLDDAGISQRQRLISELANDLDEYIELGESISDDCKEISSKVSSDWADRALSEITTPGYQPNYKHGVEINITPLSDAEIVPKTVDDEVL